jgi:hypothetical protein
MGYLDEEGSLTREQLGLPPEDNRREFDRGTSAGLWHCVARLDGQVTGMSVATGHGILWWEPLETEAESPLLEILHAHDDAVAILSEYGYVFSDERASCVTPHKVRPGGRKRSTATAKEPVAAPVAAVLPPGERPGLEQDAQVEQRAGAHVHPVLVDPTVGVEAA